jgi:site-specific recombinase XerD
MSSPARIARPHTVDLLAAYGEFVTALAVGRAQRWARLRAARLFLNAHPNLEAWMTRPTPARLTDMRRLKAWPFLSWCLVEGHVRADLELLLAKPGGCGLPEAWCARHADEVTMVAEAGRLLGWSGSWTRQVSVLALSLLCLWAGKPLSSISDGDVEAILGELDRVTYVSSSARYHARTRLFALSTACYQLGLLARPRRKHGPVSRSPGELAQEIRQPEIRREVVRYAQTLATTLRPGSVYARVKAIMVFCDWLADHRPQVRQLEQLERTAHIEPFLAWDRTRLWRGANGRGRVISATQFHHDVVDLRVFFEDIAAWGWPSQPRGRLLFSADIPRLPEPVPRALAPDVDRALMAAVAKLDDALVRTGLQVLRATGMRIGELLDLELDCLVDFGRHGPWLRVPLGKLATERMVPLDDDTVAVLDAWIARRGRQRALPHPRDGRPADFLFCEQGRRLSGHRLRRGLERAVADAGLHGSDGTPRRVTPHHLRHTYGTALVNGGISLPALMALLGHVSPEMTLRYAKLANPTIRAAYHAALDKARLARALPLAGANQATIPDRIEWLRSEMLKTRLAHGLCTRDPVAGPCPYANICEQCDNFTPSGDFTPILQAQLDDVRALRDDARSRGWDDETARHERVIASLEAHLNRVHKTPRARLDA